ncbi:MAG: hypothetical protein HQ461_00500 [Deltaproteobacteria bacterium]|nr:hypothetical protein [Deltaproteobacteria bacterium]
MVQKERGARVAQSTSADLFLPEGGLKIGPIALVGGLLFGFSETSPHQLLATLIGLGGAIFYAAGAVVTELQRIKKQLQADAMRLATHNPKP